MHDRLPLDPESGTEQTPQDYIEQVTATTGMPWASVRRNMAKVHGVLSRVEEVLGGLTRGLDLSVLDEGVGDRDGHLLSFFPRTDALGVVLPSNSPGVHSLWAPATVLKMPLVLKPGSAEPWTPLRIIQAYVRAGVPAEVFGYYPTDHAGGNEILRSCGRGMVFGDVGSTKRWKSDPRVEVHGPGWSKVVIGPDAADDWERHVDVIAESISNNGGRSCVNASGVWVTRHADRIAEALAARLAQVTPRAADDPEAVLAPFADPSTAHRISTLIDQDMAPGEGEGQPTARDVSAGVRGPDRVATVHGGTYLLPTIVRCEAGPRARQPRVPVPLRQRRRGAGRAPARVPRTVARGHVHLERPGLPAALRLRLARGPPQHRPDSHDADRLGSAARGESVRAPVRAAGLSAAGIGNTRVPRATCRGLNPVRTAKCSGVPRTQHSP